MDDKQLRGLQTRIDAIEHVVSDLAARWVRSQNFTDQEKFATNYAPVLQQALGDDARPDLRRAVECLWTKVINRLPVK